VECARSWLVQMGFGRFSSLILAGEFGSFGRIRTTVHFGELHLVLRSVVRNKIILTWGLSVVAYSRRGE